ncbi:low-density lipoprotein receptor-related protein 2 [Paramormyrops kingsleyae]|uniref:low-density lipoprotein receptor-related protein 2 n=1 Tax=Paramormyrops kingsleyae TaxID=1676925 RepID=UPI000CD5F125|nr:low-density lipoprotein receptor-related protein 4-like isoform X1 [Paramormyrops kingsleyae]
MDLLVFLNLLTLCGCGNLAVALSAADGSLPAPAKCPFGSFPCKDGRGCALHSHFCDGDKDCKDGSDEVDCPVQCDAEQFQCAHGRKCIKLSEVCDGTAQCQDRSDEKNCWKPTDECAVRCDNTRCIPSSFRCDGERDCLDGTDEEDCDDGECESGEFQCASGQCVSGSAHCDGHADCHDRSDEKGCQSSGCPGQKRCSDTGRCLLPVWVCDGEEDCQDGSDEKDCPAAQVTCGEFQWTCASKTQCIPISWHCDREVDCSDRSDEAGCAPAGCPSHQFQCGTGECVDPASVCNASTDCVDGSDEGPACHNDACSSPGSPQCAFKCYNTPQGARCSCNVGFELLADQVTCVDSNECKAAEPPCSHICMNTEGSYRCHCHPGYQLAADDHGCEITGEPLLLASMQNELLLHGLRRSSLDIHPTTSKKAIMWVDYDWRDQKIFWVNLEADSIKWNSLDKRNKGTIVKGVKADCLGVDWVGRNLYWIDGERGEIHAVTLDTTTTAQNSIIVVDEDLEQPRFLLLMPETGMMFWSDIGGEPRIERAGMDGSERRTVVWDKLSWPGSLAVDSLGGRIYWTDEKLRCIGSATLDGQDIKLLQLTETPRPFSVAVFEDMVYWSDTERRTVQRANKHTGKHRETLLKQDRQVLGVRIVHKLLQEDASNPCLQLRCSHLCLLAPGPRAVCRCPSGFLLDHDGLTCSQLEDSAFIYILSPTSVTQVYLQSLGTVVGQNWPDHHVLALPGIDEATALAYVQWNHSLYVADAGRGSVEVFRLQEGNLQHSHAVVKLHGDDVVIAMAVDHITLNLYWCSREQPGLHVTSGSGAYTAVLLDDLTAPSAVALHPPAGQICFSDLARVECAYMDGRNRSLLWQKAQNPCSLTFSPDGSRLYWANTGAGVISSIGIDGSGYKEFETGGRLIDALACSDSVLFWVTVNDTTKVWFSDGTLAKQLWFEVKANIVDLKAYSKNVQEGSNLCSNRNGECGHLCLAFPGGRTCRCVEGHHLANESHCVAGHPCPPDSKACLDGQTCLPTIKFCDGHPDCPDHSDENCTVDLLRPRGPRPSFSAPSSAVPTSLDDLLQRELEAESCDERLCGGRGKCVSVPDGGTACECHSGFQGTFCEDGAPSVQPLITYAGGALAAVVVVAVAALFVIRRRKAAGKRRERVVTMAAPQTEMVARVEGPPAQASASPPEAHSPEEPVSPEH